MDFQPGHITGIIELKDVQDIDDGVESCTDIAISGMSVIPPKSRGSVIWNNWVIAIPTACGATKSG
jgi:hypothetical protein